jgi:hypothetical protein
MATPEEIAVVVTAEDFAAALRDLVPSVSQAEMAKYAQIRQRFSRTVNNYTTDGGADDDQGSNIDTRGKGKGKATLTATSHAPPTTANQALTEAPVSAALTHHSHSNNAPPAAVTGDSQGESSVPGLYVFEHKETGVIRKVHDTDHE